MLYFVVDIPGDSVVDMVEDSVVDNKKDSVGIEKNLQAQLLEGHSGSIDLAEIH